MEGHFEIVKHNSFILRKVNANAQFILWKNFKICNESKIALIDPDYYRKPINFIRFLAVNYFTRRKKNITGKSVWLLDNWSKNYYHWMVEALPKLLSTKLDAKEVTVILPSSYKRTRFHEETLRLLGVPFDFFDEEKERLYCDELYVPLNVAIMGTSSPLFISKLRARLLINSPTRTNRRLYISRKKALKRKVMNEDELVKILYHHGFETISFEDFSFLEQIQISSEAEVLLGLHGAGLTNVMFMHQGATVIELSREGDDNYCYRHLAFSSGLAYHALPCSGVTTDLHATDFIVDLKKIASVFEVLNFHLSNLNLAQREQ